MNVSGAYLRGTNLSDTDLQEANLGEADLDGQSGDSYNEKEIQAMWIGFAHRICDLYHEDEPAGLLTVAGNL